MTEISSASFIGLASLGIVLSAAVILAQGRLGRRRRPIAVPPQNDPLRLRYDDDPRD
jgi:hypothetical protein